MKLLRLAISTGLVLAFSSLGQAHFGHSGMSGSDGFPGRDGSDGSNKTVIAQGQSEDLNLRGQPGRSGGDGRNGGSASFCSQPHHTHHDLSGAPGGSGGDGGRGGNGGDGGDLLVYYANIQNLKNISVDANPGGGAGGGYGGSGAHGCHCSHQHWHVQECHEERNSGGHNGGSHNSGGHNNNRSETVCIDKEYHCHHGRSGRRGSSGYSGRSGSMGSLTIVSQLTPLAGTNPNASVEITQLETAPISLSKNVWLRKSGALALLGPDSRISDSYTMFSHRQDWQYKMTWKADRSINNFRGSRVSLTAQDRSVQANFGNVWVKATQSINRNTVTTIVTKALKASEATDLVMGIHSHGPGASLSVKDMAQKSDVLSTSFHLKFERKGTFGHATRFNGPVPAQYVKKPGPHSFIIQIGQFIDRKYFKPGKSFKVTLTVTRSLGQKRAQKVFSKVKHKIPK